MIDEIEILQECHCSNFTCHTATAMTDNLWLPLSFYSIGIEITPFLCRFAKDDIVNYGTY